MQLAIIMVGSLFLILGSLTAAALLCWLLWQVFRRLRHPEWVALVVAMLVMLYLTGKLPTSQFLGMTLTFAMVTALGLWPAGRSWRDQRLQALKRKRAQFTDLRWKAPLVSQEFTNSERSYPVIAACICEERSPTRDEIHFVVARLWAEGVGRNLELRSGLASFRAKRFLLRAAHIALCGSNLGKRTAGSEV